MDSVDYIINEKVVRTSQKEDLWQRWEGMNWNFDRLMKHEVSQIFESLGGVTV